VLTDVCLKYVLYINKIGALSFWFLYKYVGFRGKFYNHCIGLHSINS